MVTGASNVTGEIWPIGELAQAAHRADARIAVDAAQLAPHRPLDAVGLDLDYVALSGHKLYAPFGVGALIGRSDWLRAAPPYLVGGGATASVGEDQVSWADLPDRHEGGNPNVVGAVALATACATLTRAGRHDLARAESDLYHRLRRGLAGVPGVRQLRLFGEAHSRVGISSFVTDGWDGRTLAAVLSAEYGIGVRAGSFCAHPFVRRLTAGPGGCRSSEVPVRASIGVGTAAEHVDRLVDALHEIVAHGAGWSYAERGGEVLPSPDPRGVPALPWE